MVLESDKKPFLYGVLTTVAFLGTAAILYFSSSMQIASFFAGLTAGLITHCCDERNPDHGLSGAGVTTTVFENKAK